MNIKYIRISAKIDIASSMIKDYVGSIVYDDASTKELSNYADVFEALNILTKQTGKSSVNDVLVDTGLVLASGDVIANLSNMCNAKDPTLVSNINNIEINVYDDDDKCFIIASFKVGDNLEHKVYYGMEKCRAIVKKFEDQMGKSINDLVADGVVTEINRESINKKTFKINDDSTSTVKSTEPSKPKGKSKCKVKKLVVYATTFVILAGVGHYIGKGIKNAQIKSSLPITYSEQNDTHYGRAIEEIMNDQVNVCNILARIANGQQVLQGEYEDALLYLSVMCNANMHDIYGYVNKNEKLDEAPNMLGLHASFQGNSNENLVVGQFDILRNNIVGKAYSERDKADTKKAIDKFLKTYTDFVFLGQPMEINGRKIYYNQLNKVGQLYITNYGMAVAAASKDFKYNANGSQFTVSSIATASNEMQQGLSKNVSDQVVYGHRK